MDGESDVNSIFIYPANRVDGNAAEMMVTRFARRSSSVEDANKQVAIEVDLEAHIMQRHA